MLEYIFTLHPEPLYEIEIIIKEYIRIEMLHTNLFF